MVLQDLVAPQFGQLVHDIKSMRLYNKPELVSALYRNLAHAGLAEGPIPFEKLAAYDHHIYYGTKAVDSVIESCGIKAAHRVINIGSGMGGPARYLAGKTGCQVRHYE